MAKANVAIDNLRTDKKVSITFSGHAESWLVIFYLKDIKCKCRNPTLSVKNIKISGYYVLVYCQKCWIQKNEWKWILAFSALFIFDTTIFLLALIKALFRLKSVANVNREK